MMIRLKVTTDAVQEQSQSESLREALPPNSGTVS